jgi:acyl-CoA synthetase (AMP-forming)/AMP-acid ligase II
MHTPYGATECLPIATIDAAEVLNETAVQTNAGAGVCVGRKFESIDWRVIRITDDPIEAINDAEELPPGEIGELVVLGPQASPRYVTRTEVNAQSKIAQQSAIRNPQSEVIPWHRTGDVGYLDDAGRFWYCGRKSHRVETTSGTLFTEPVEAIFNVHRILSRTALVGIGERGKQIPVVVYEPRPIRALYPGGRCNSPEFYESIADDLRELATKHTMTRDIRNFLRHPSLPVDVRHNAKINREQLAVWAAQQLPHVPSQPPTSRP